METVKERTALGCDYCKPDWKALGERGYIEMDNNGPIYRCPICNPEARTVLSEASGGTT